MMITITTPMTTMPSVEPITELSPGAGVVVTCTRIAAAFNCWAEAAGWFKTETINTPATTIRTSIVRPKICEVFIVFVSLIVSCLKIPLFFPLYVLFCTFIV